MIALSPREQFEYVLEEDRESDEPTVWILKPLDLREVIEVEDLIGTGRKNDRFPVGSFNSVVLKSALIGWRHLLDKNRNEVPFVMGPDKKVPDDVLASLESNQRSELALAAWRGSSLSEEQAKNSKSRSTSRKES